MISEQNLIELPTSEEVYDWDTNALQELANNLQIQLKKEIDFPKQWLKKAKKIDELIQLELEERSSISNIRKNQENKNYSKPEQYTQINLQDFAQCNLALEKILLEIQNRPLNYLDDTKQTQNKITEIKEEYDEESTDNLESQNPGNILSNSQITDFSRMSKFNKLKNNGVKKKNDMHDFMKNLLSHTRITDNQVIGAASGGKYIPPPKQPILTPTEKGQLERLQKREVHSKINSLPQQGNTNTQMGEVQTGLMLGRPAFSNRALQKQLQEVRDKKELKQNKDKKSKSVNKRKSSNDVYLNKVGSVISRQSTASDTFIPNKQKFTKDGSSSLHSPGADLVLQQAGASQLGNTTTINVKNQDRSQSNGTKNFEQNNIVQQNQEKISTISDQVNSTGQNNIEKNNIVQLNQEKIGQISSHVNSTGQNNFEQNNIVQFNPEKIGAIITNVISTGQNNFDQNNIVKLNPEKIGTISAHVNSTGQNNFEQNNIVKLNPEKISTISTHMNSSGQNNFDQKDIVQLNQEKISTISTHANSSGQNNFVQNNIVQMNEISTISTQVNSKGQNQSIQNIDTTKYSQHDKKQIHNDIENDNEFLDNQNYPLNIKKNEKNEKCHTSMIKLKNQSDNLYNENRVNEEQNSSLEQEIQENYEVEDDLEDMHEEELTKRKSNQLKKIIRIHSNTNTQASQEDYPIKKSTFQDAKDLCAEMNIEEKFYSDRPTEVLRAEIDQYRLQEQDTQIPFRVSQTISVSLKKQDINQIITPYKETSSNGTNHQQKASEQDWKLQEQQKIKDNESKLSPRSRTQKDLNEKDKGKGKDRDREKEKDEKEKEKEKQKQNADAKTRKPRVPLAPKPKANYQNSQQSKYILKMMEYIDDEKLVDYSNQIPTFQNLFSQFYNSPSQHSHIDGMREIYALFQQHVERVDNVDNALSRYKPNSLMSFQPSEMIYINDPTKIITYAQKTGIDLQSYIQRISSDDDGNKNLPTMYFRVIKSKEEVYDIITRSFMRKKQWSELPHGIALKTSWNILWTWSKPQIDMNKLILFQKVNHFPFNKNISRKDLLKKNIERCQRLGQKASQCFDIIPSTYLLPKEYVQFMEQFYLDMESEGAYNIWIMKPTSQSRGRGIQMVNDISQVMYAEPVVLQKYLKDPLLLKGYKFDMRIYVVVTSFNPLEAFLYKEGFARLATQPFSLELSDLKNLIIHLTNYAIQKSHVDGGLLETSFGGSKISLRQLRDQLHDKGVDWKNIWTQVQEIVVKSLIAVQAEIPHNPNCFELFGYDIIIDQSKKCWLLEVNASPSLGRDYILDELIKQQLIDDIFDLISPNYFDRSRLMEVLERRILEEQGCKSTINTTNNSKLQLNRDLNYMLSGQTIRKYGEMPAKLGGFDRIAPGEIHDKVHKLVQSYKVQGPGARGTID